ncbi:MAG: FHA domain-containing protein [Lentisphaerae bacterium]|jgi:pSer/pThr/pTyr-binding forkhead associated (FHA) protein|nr:FHA domain-containing protein [Lentisphaerota bacterium]
MSVKITILSEQMRGASFALNNERYTIGRSDSADICIPDPTISGHHCTLIQLEPDVYAVRDEGCTNGTRVNGEKVTTEAVQLKHGDLLQVGGVEILYDNAQEHRYESRSMTVINLEDTGTIEVSAETMKNLAGKAKGKKSAALRENPKHNKIMILILSLLGVLTVIGLVLMVLKCSK